MARRHVRLPFGRFLPPTGSEFVAVEVLGGLVLLVATTAALVWANLDADSYERLWSAHLELGAGRFSIDLDRRHWVNDGLMTVFFFVVGIEIKRELVHGELRDRRAATLPAVAALGGMLVPALIYTAINVGGVGGRGWGIPMATDIAFAVAVIAMAGSRLPAALKLFLLTLAIVDDIGAIAVIAIFYSGPLSLRWIAGAVATVAAVWGLRRIGARSPIAYVVPALALWVCVFESGVHATIAGVALGLATPATDGTIERLEGWLHPWSSFVIVPVFALANAGVVLTAEGLTHARGSAISWGIALGLVVGKPLGILAAAALALRLGWGRLPEGLRLAHVLGAGAVAGIGFTVSLFVADLSFAGAPLVDAKVAILAASVASGIVGAVVLRLTARADGTP